jgi:hypothetical protein
VPKELTDIYCVYCDRQEGGKTQSRMLNKQGGYVCTGQGHKFPNYIAMMALKPRMDRLVIQEKQPSSAISHPMWIHPEALSALQTRFPSNFRTTIYTLFNALANPDTILLEAEHCKELRDLGISKGREIVGLAKTNKELSEQLKLMTEQMKQYELVAKMMAMAGGGMFNNPGAQGATVAEMLQPGQQDRPPQAATLPVIDTDSDTTYEPVAPGSFAGSFSDQILAPPPLVQPARGFPKPTPGGR